ncbi:MAG TPA: MBOAT family O-acyltransferase [Planctomycetota bacterium]|nr:MBOAT family O-acyltransferase [Planctomycetota bacterium]
MVFSSHIFVYYFLPAALALYYALYRAPQRWRNASLILMGYVFYGWANPKFIFLMFGTTFLDWLLSLVVAYDSWRFWRDWGGECRPLPRGARTRTQRWAVIGSVVSNLAMLGFFKYFNFGVDSYNALVEGLGLGAARWDTFFRVVLPLGISFYTFQSMSYIIDVYRGEAKAMRNFADFSCFVSMFPHLVAGPILKFSYLADQIENRRLTLDKFARGVAFFGLGMAKKILLANPCGKIADLAFDSGSVGTLDSWFGAVAYAFQIYFDFSGYSDMAIGLGLMLGFVFARNFNCPYRSQNITEFWRRWHMSLSSWFRGYLFTPLEVATRYRMTPAWRTPVNLMITMLLVGLWHGASWNYVIWGGIQGAMMAAEQIRGKKGFYNWLPVPLRVAVTFLIVIVSWVFFRGGDLSHIMGYLGTMFGLGQAAPGAGLLGGIIYQPYYLASFIIAGYVVWRVPDTWEATQKLSWWKVALVLGLFLLALVVLRTQEYNPFIYFIF